MGTESTTENGRAPELILASGSPRRRALLAELGLECRAVVSDIDETQQPDESPMALVLRLASSKARSVDEMLRAGAVAMPEAENHRDRLIIAADTVVALEGEVLGKPTDPADAVRMLRAQRGREHQVISAISVLHAGTQRQETVANVTQVHMRDYSDAEIEAYVASGDPFDKAGAYAIQHPVFAPVKALDGCPVSVMGLPLADLRDLLRRYGVIPCCPVAEICVRQTQFGCCQLAGE